MSTINLQKMQINVILRLTYHVNQWYALDMEIKEYIRKRKITVAEAASEIGISRVWLSYLINGRSGSKGTAVKIRYWSKGMVPVFTVMFPEGDYKYRKEDK